MDPASTKNLQTFAMGTEEPTYSTIDCLSLITLIKGVSEQTLMKCSYIDGTFPALINSPWPTTPKVKVLMLMIFIAIDFYSLQTFFPTSFLGVVTFVELKKQTKRDFQHPFCILWVTVQFRSCKLVLRYFKKFQLLAGPIRRRHQVQQADKVLGLRNKAEKREVLHRNSRYTTLFLHQTFIRLTLKGERTRNQQALSASLQVQWEQLPQSGVLVVQGHCVRVVQRGSGHFE